jgi:ribosomal-protein-alanine N-acetyltransferase
MPTNTLTRVHVRWVIATDLPAVLRIEAESFPDPWDLDDFTRCLKQRNIIGMVAESGDRVVGYVLYELLRDDLHVLNIAVDQRYRRTGVGTQLVEKLEEKVFVNRRSGLVADVHERNLTAQLFFRASGFRCVAVERGLYDDGAADAYRFEMSVRGKE